LHAVQVIPIDSGSEDLESFSASLRPLRERKMKIMKKNNGSRLHVDASNFKGTHEELRRAQYVLAFLQTSSKACSLKESGLSLRHTHA
jgi:hypothetical protein